MSFRSKRLIRKIRKDEQASYINTESSLSSKDISTRTLLPSYDYEAPLTSHTLSPNSKWLIVRHNIHKIRGWGEMRHSSIKNKPFEEWYLYFQMRRELKRAEQEIRAIQYRRDFRPVRYFDLPIDEHHVRRHNVSHVRPNDGIYYGGLGSEPIVLEYLLYYFSKECVVPYNSIFYGFLCDLTSVLDTNRKRIQQVVVYRRVALIFALAIFIIILIMFFSLILSVLTTTSNLRQMYKNDSSGQTKTSLSKT
jgi:hypothetical protein